MSMTDDIPITRSLTPRSFILLYANDILLTALSISELQRLFSNCEREVQWLDTHINVKKSHYMRIGPRLNVSCTRVTTSDGHSISLPWVDEKSYLGRYTKSQKTRHQTLAHYFPKY